MIGEIISEKSPMYKVTMHLGKTKDICSIRKMMVDVKIPRGSISESLNKLEREGMVMCFKLEDKSRDNRSKYWKLSEKGKKVYELLIEFKELTK